MGESSNSKQNLLIKSRVDTEHWSSQLCFHSYNENAADNNACNKQPSFANRQLVLNDGNQSYLFSGNLFSGLNNDSFKLANNNNLNNLEWRDGLLNWFSRSTADNQIKQNGFVVDYRQRPDKSGLGSTRNMGDIINNSIETIGQTEFNKQKYLITSANDGMVYVFRAANSDTNPYDLKFNYMPMSYAGDYGGNLYRFDIRDPHPDNWTVNKIFTADGPITTAPVLFEAAHDDKDPNAAHKVIVVFGTGSDLYQSDLQSKKQQAIYGIYDDYEQKTVSPVNKGELLQQTMSYSNNTGQLSSLPFSSAKYKGWYFRLNTDGERVTTAFSQLLSIGMVITRSYDLQKKNGNQGPKSDPCQIKHSSHSTNIQSRITQFDSRNGGQIDKNNPHFILDQNKNTIQSSYSINGFIGVMVSGINHYNSLNAGKSGQQKIPGDITPNENCLLVKPSAHLSSGEYIELGGIPMCPVGFKRIGWREIKETIY